MKKVLLFIIVLALGFLFWNINQKTPKKTPTKEVSSTSTMREQKEADALDQSRILFVPYWTLGKEEVTSDVFDRLIYFGVAPNLEGIDKEDVGYKKLSSFNKLADKRRDKYIVLRMLDSKTNFAILESKEVQEKIVLDVIKIAEDNSFSGVILDLEISSLPFDSVISQINDFVKLASSEVKKEKLTFSIIMYGDTFYRVRPYDIKSITGFVDQMYVMTYDFHKSRGNPGPNFPYIGKNDYGYDFVTMVDDFSKIVAKDKLVFVFGLFGYDWIIDDKGRSMQNGVPLSYNEIKQKFLDKCLLKDCVVKTSTISAETNVVYQDDALQKHSVWFEDMDSVAKKKVYLNEKGISSLGFWAYSYF